MLITHKIKTDLELMGATQVVNVVQDDKYSRNLEIALFSGNVSWTPPVGTEVVVRYAKPDGKGGNYNILPDGSAAGSISGYVVTVTLAPQVCTTPGVVLLTVGLLSEGKEINTFVIEINVQKNPGINVESDDYTRLQTVPLFANSVKDCVDTSKLYVLPDGYIYAYMSQKTGGYTNLIPQSTDTDGSIYNGTGYKAASRCNSSGAVVDVSNKNATNPPFATGFIPCKQGDVIRLKNCYIHASYTMGEVASKALYGEDMWGIRCALYNANKEMIGVFSWGNLSQGLDTDKITYVQDDEDFQLTQFSIAMANTAYIRLCLATDTTPADAIATVNEQIIGGESTEEYAWANTGHAFVPADYEDRIIALEEAVMGDLPIYGIVDDENNILMSGTLVKGTYKLKYVAEDGTTTELCEFTME